MGAVGQDGLAGIDNEQLSAAIHRSQHPAGDLGMGLGGVGTGNQNNFRVFDLVDRIGHGAAAEGGGKTCHRGGVSEAGTVVDVIGLQDCPGKFLQEIVLFIGVLGRGEHPDTLGIGLIADAAKFLGRKVQGLIPASGSKHAIFSDQGLGQSFGGVDEFMDMPALNAEITPGNRMVATGGRADDATTFFLEVKTAAATAIDAGSQGVAHGSPRGYKLLRTESQTRFLSYLKIMVLCNINIVCRDLLWTIFLVAEADDRRP